MEFQPYSAESRLYPRLLPSFLLPTLHISYLRINDGSGCLNETIAYSSDMPYVDFRYALSCMTTQMMIEDRIVGSIPAETSGRA